MTFEEFSPTHDFFDYKGSARSVSEHLPVAVDASFESRGEREARQSGQVVLPPQYSSSQRGIVITF